MNVKLSDTSVKFVNQFAKKREISATEAVNRLLETAAGRLGALAKYNAAQAAAAKPAKAKKAAPKKTKKTAPKAA
jgi:hypothetical protein